MKLANAIPVENVDQNLLSQEVQMGRFPVVVSQCLRNSRGVAVNLILRIL